MHTTRRLFLRFASLPHVRTSRGDQHGLHLPDISRCVLNVFNKESEIWRPFAKRFARSAVNNHERTSCTSRRKLNPSKQDFPLSSGASSLTLTLYPSVDSTLKSYGLKSLECLWPLRFTERCSHTPGSKEVHAAGWHPGDTRSSKV